MRFRHAGAAEEEGESEAEIQRALFVGNYAAALDACLKVGLNLFFTTIRW